MEELSSKGKLMHYHPSLAVSYKAFVPIIAKLANIPEHIVQSAIVHSFSFVKRWVNNPILKARFSIPELGTFTLNKVKIYKDLEKYIRLLRTETDPDYLEGLRYDFRTLWILKQLINVYERKTHYKYNPHLINKSRKHILKKQGVEIVHLGDPYNGYKTSVYGDGIGVGADRD